MTPIEAAEFYLSSFGHCHHDPLASKKIIEDLLTTLKDFAGIGNQYGEVYIRIGEFRHRTYLTETEIKRSYLPALFGETARNGIRQVVSEFKVKNEHT